MNFLGRLLFLVGLAAVLIGGFDVSLLLRGTRSPEVVTITELGADDGTRNVHLAVTDFQFGDGFVLEEEEGEWKRVWVPILTPEGKWTDRPVVLHTTRVANEGDLDRLYQRETVTGIVTNFRQGLGSNQRKEFAKSYPSADLRGAIALELDGRFPSPFVAYPMAIVGAIMFLFGIGMLFGFVGGAASEEDVMGMGERDQFPVLGDGRDS